MRLSKKQSVIAAVCLILGFIGISLSLLSNRKSIPVTAENDPIVNEDAPGTVQNLSVVEQAKLDQNPEEPESPTKFVLHEFHRIETKDGKPLWEIKGKQGDFDPITKRSKISEPTFSVYRPNGEHVHLAANEALIYIDGTKLLKASAAGDVKINFGEKMFGTMQSASFIRETESVVAEGNVEITSNNVKVTGGGLNANLNNNVFEFTQGVKTIIQPKKRSNLPNKGRV